MIYLDGIGLSFLIKETKDKIQNYRLTKIYQYDRTSFSLYFGKNNLLFQVKNNSTVFYVKNEKDVNTDYQSKFLLSLKKYLLNSILVNIRQESFDRIVYFDFEKLNQFGDIEKYTLIMEIMGKASNIFLTSGNKILAALYFTGIDLGNRVVMTGANYELPFENKKISPIYLEEENFPFEIAQFMEKIEGVGKVFATECANNFEKFSHYINNYFPIMYEINQNKKVLTYNKFEEFEKNSINKTKFETFTEGLNEYFKSTITSNVINDKKITLLKYVENQIKKYEKIEKNIIIDLKKNENYITFKNIGDILAANMHNIKYGQKEVKTYDFYNNCEIKIELDPLISPKENLSFYYNKYNKGKRTIEALENRLITIKEETKYFEQIKIFIEKENDFVGIEEIENELNLTKNNQTKIKLNKVKKRELLSFENKGFKILVGRNNKENEEITFSKGNVTDIWLHAKDIPGSHVLIIANNQKIDDDVLLYAANLAAQYSKAEKGHKIDIDYCQKKFVKKIKNSKPGNVTYTNFNTITITI